MFKPIVAPISTQIIKQIYKLLIGMKTLHSLFTHRPAAGESAEPAAVYCHSVYPTNKTFTLWKFY